jgi:hypothetical protein
MAEGSKDAPSGLDLDQARNPSDRERSTWLSRAFLGLLGVVVLLGLLNVFGQVTTTSEASTAAASVRVIAPTDLRAGLLFQLSVTVTARRDLHDATLVLASGWFSGMSTNAEVPQPGSQTARGGDPVFSLGQMPRGDTQTIRVYFQVNPTTVAWRRDQSVELDDGAARLLVVHRTVTVYP